MKNYLLLLLFALCVTNLTAMQKQKPRKTLNSNTNNNNTPQQECVSIGHNITTLSINRYQYKQDILVKSDFIIVGNSPRNIPLTTENQATKTVLVLRLPTSPERLILECGSNKIAAGDDIYIRDDYNEHIVIENRAKKTTLFTLPKQNSYIHIGKTTDTPQQNKSITIHNVNTMLVAVIYKTYQKPICISEQFYVSGSKLLNSSSVTLRKKENTIVSTISFENEPRIIDAVLILDIQHALRKVKIRPNDNAIQNNSKIFIAKSSDEKFIRLVNQDNVELTRISTAKDSVKI